MAQYEKIPPKELFPDESPSQDRSGRFPRDDRLRAAGFRIHRRKKGQPPEWEKDGVIYPEPAALEEARKAVTSPGGRAK